MTIIKYRYFSVILHTLIWSVVLFFPFFISSAGNRYKIGPLPGLYFTLSGIVHIIIFYVNAFILYPKLFNRNFWFLYVISAVLLLVFSFRMKLFILETFFPDDMREAVHHIMFPSAAAFIVSTFYGIAVERIRAEKLQKEKEALQLGMELKLLRSQISPHFLFNILTNLVSLARKKSDQLETSLLKLSGLMRYMLNDTGKKISLQQEVDYLQNYIALQKLRFGQEVTIVFNIGFLPSETNHYIEPMLLIPFVENAFKHGTGVDQPFIDINVTLKQGGLIFQVKNKFDPDPATSKDESSGIGLNNVRSRLALLYPGRHELLIHNDNNLFSIYLTLKLL